MSAERTIRDALRSWLLTEIPDAQSAVDELWVPRSNERADLALIGRTMDGFEIKSEQDSLRRLPRQIGAYGRLFDHCTAVVAEKHAAAALGHLPEWWGLVTVRVNGAVCFTQNRPSRPNPRVDTEALVRLLWREEAMGAVLRLGGEPEPTAPRSSLWDSLLRIASDAQLKGIVRDALVRRDPAKARIATRRFALNGRALAAQ